MTTIEDAVAEHYASGALTRRIREALESLGVDPDAATPDDLKPVDEFHTGGVQATEDLLAQVAIGPETAVLDIGSGLGGTARFIASRYGARVEGVDLTPEFVETAQDLSALAGLSELTSFQVGSALDLPVSDGAFDLATMLHVGMNVEDKARLMAEARRALKPGGIFAVFDVMRGDDESADLLFPLPWSTVAGTSFVVPLAAYEAAAAGFEIVAARPRAQFALDFFADVFAKVARDGPSPLGIHLLMGETAGDKIKNYVENVKTGRIAPTELILKAV